MGGFNISFIRINETILRDANVPIKLYTTYIGLLINTGLNKEFTKHKYVSAFDICFSLTNTEPFNRYLIETVNTGLKGLKQIGIDACSACVQSHYIVDLQSLKKLENYDGDNSDFYVDVDVEELQKIYSLNDADKYRLARFYVLLCSLITGKNSVGQWDLNTLSLKSHLSIPTIREYRKKIQQLELIDFADVLFVNDNGHFFPILFSKWANRQLLHKKIERLKKKNTFIPRKQYADGRSLWQKYYWMKQGKKYSEQEAKQIYIYVCDKYNQACREMQECEIDSYKHKKSFEVAEAIDFTCFEQYDFYNK